MSQAVLTNEYVKASLARAVPDAEYDGTQKAWVLDTDECSDRSAAIALQLFPQLYLDFPELEEKRQNLMKDVRPFDNATPYNHRIVAPVVEAVLATEGKSLYDFQAIDLGYHEAVLRQHGASYLGWGRGMGKTIGALCLVDALDVQSVLAVVPNTAKVPVWEPDVMTYIAAKFDRVITLPNTKAKRERTMADVLKAKRDGESVFLIVHYEALAIIAGKSGRGWDKYGVWGIIIGDEIHRVSNPKIKMTRALKKVPAEYKLGLSGSIIMNHVQELFSQLQWLYPERYKSKWRDWNDRFLDYVEGGFGKVFVGIIPESLDELQNELGVIMTYRRKEDELDLPELIAEDRHVPLSPGQRRVYDSLVATCIAEIDNGEYVAAMDGLPMLSKLRQIATGLDLVGDEIRDSSKLDLAVELIQDNPDEQFVVFSWFKAACTALQERLGEGVVITGDVPQNKRDALVQQFKANDDRILIATIKTMGESQNFQNANNVIFIDRSWNPSDNIQAGDRVYRIGQEKKVTMTNIIAKDTVDEHRVTPTLANKDALRQLLLGG